MARLLGGVSALWRARSVIAPSLSGVGGGPGAAPALYLGQTGRTRRALVGSGSNAALTGVDGDARSTDPHFSEPVDDCRCAYWTAHPALWYLGCLVVGTRGEPGMPLRQPHIVFRTRPHTNLTDYWTGDGWSPEMRKAKPVEWRAGLDLITAYRGDHETAECGFGMNPAGSL